MTVHMLSPDTRMSTHFPVHEQRYPTVKVRHNTWYLLDPRSGDEDRLTSSPKSVDCGAVGHRCIVCLSGRNLDVRRVAMATNGEWKVLVDILYCVA